MVILEAVGFQNWNINLLSENKVELQATYAL